MSRSTRYSLPVLLLALWASIPMARAEGDKDTETINLYASKITDACPAVALSVLDEELQPLVADRAAYVAKVCQCVVNEAVNDERTLRLMTTPPAVREQLLFSDRNQRYLAIKVLAASLRCVALEIDNLMSNYRVDDGSSSADTPTAKP